MELTGKIIAVLPANSGVSNRTGNPWMSQEFVIEVPGQYPRKCVFRVFGEDRIKQFNIQQGEDLTIQFDIDAHEYNGRWFVFGDANREPFKCHKLHNSRQLALQHHSRQHRNQLQKVLLMIFLSNLVI